MFHLPAAAKAGLPEGPVVELLSGIAENGIVSGYVKRIAEQDFNAEVGAAVSTMQSLCIYIYIYISY